jgi:hypothetical protein
VQGAPALCLQASHVEITAQAVHKGMLPIFLTLPPQHTASSLYASAHLTPLRNMTNKITDRNFGSATGSVSNIIAYPLTNLNAMHTHDNNLNTCCF